VNFGIIGNCGYSALIEEGRVIWLCWPRFDSSFVFGELLDPSKGGAFAVESIEPKETRHEYLENTNVLRTVLESAHGSFEVLDFAPRFRLFERFYKPTMLVRILRPLSGEPLVRVRCEPTGNYGRERLGSWLASNHIQFQGLPWPLRLTTDIPLTYVAESRPFLLSKPHYLVLTCGEPLESPLEETSLRFLERTVDYWRQWVKSIRITKEFQREVIRSALVLKLHQYEDTGAIIASTTTSLPEFPGSGRNWDYRYCWLRDAYFALHAFERLGHFGEMERFLAYLRNICETHGDDLQPLYGINGDTQLTEQVLGHLHGYRGERPVRIGNQAHEHLQNDVYGEMILAVSRMLLDVRFASSEGFTGAQPLVHRLLKQIERRVEEPDAGPWELRNSKHLHTFTLLMHWAGARRAAEVGQVVGDSDLVERARTTAARARKLIMERCWNAELGALTQRAGAAHLDAATLLALHFGFLDPRSPEASSHVDAIRKGLQTDGLLRRYNAEDDFGPQQAAFTVCSFWLAEALAIIGRLDEARELFARILPLGNPLGLFSEDIISATGQLAGNFPQTYSHVGLLNTAFRLSEPWD